ncbi:MAG TPA: sulfite exporter TauE/SafE family protein [Gemmatimonadales bacterium]
MTTVWVGLIGLVAGIVSGFFGVGGAVVIIPGLVLLAKMDQHTANGTSLASLLLPVGLLGALQYYKQGKVNIPFAALLAAGLFLGAYFGARWAGSVPDAVLRRAFGAMLLLLSVKLLFF